MPSDRTRTMRLVAVLLAIPTGCGQDPDLTTGATLTVPVTYGSEPTNPSGVGEVSTVAATESSGSTDGGASSGPAPTTGPVDDTGISTTHTTADTTVDTTAGTTIDTTAGTTVETTAPGTSETTAPAPECGNAVLEPGEACDDGNDSNLDACTNACELASCGDGFVGPDEACDDGNDSNLDACTNACKLVTCGDGFKQPGEACDLGGSNSNTGTCTLSCKLPVCGDTFVQVSNAEQCDDGNLSNTDSCVGTCKFAKCGDSFVQQGVEQCDDGNLVSNDGCSGSCKIEAQACAPGKFLTIYCLQTGTKMQYTRCASVANNGKTCNNPEIKYGNTTGGVPSDYFENNDYVKWCKQLGFAGWGGQITYGNRPCDAPGGRLWGCADYDEFVWHWCDWDDGYWYNDVLDYNDCNDGKQVTSITCL